MSVETPPVFIQSGGETAERARRMLAATFSLRGGIVATGDLAVTENGTPNMSVNVATGIVVIPGTEATYQGVYVAENRGALNVAISPANATNPRKDLIVARIRDAAYSGATNSAAIEVVTGVPAVSPAEPAIPSNSWVLAMVDVPANDTAITNSQITDRRSSQSGQQGQAASLGGVIVCTSTAMPPHVEGRVIYQTDTDILLISDGSVWRNPRNLLGIMNAADRDKKIQMGTDSVSVTTTGNVWTKTVTFPTAFASTPLVFVNNAIGTGGAKKYAMATDTPTTSAVTVVAMSTDLNPPSGAISVPFHWLAIGS
jgi:hypothetical protein